jgi:single-strand DNA-binding protein
MASINKAIVIGNLGRDPELKRTNEGKAVCSFSVATTERFKDVQGQQQENTEWHNVSAWNKLAETAAQYLKKGSSVYIEGKLKTRSWDDNGQKKYKTEIVASSMQFLDSKPAGQGQQQQGQYNQQPSQPQQQQQGQNQQQQQQQCQQPQQLQFIQQPQPRQFNQNQPQNQQYQQPQNFNNQQQSDDDLPF